MQLADDGNNLVTSRTRVRSRRESRRQSRRWHCVTVDQSIDEALGAFEVKREVVVAILGGFSSALAVARASDLIVTVPERHSGTLRAGMHTFPLPFATKPFTISLIWHPRLDADPAHKWLRGCVKRACAGSA